MSEARRTRSSFILGDPQEARRVSIRSFVLKATALRCPAFAEGGHLVLKEPSGSIGAPLLMDALPESRMIFLIRDFRGVLTSYMDAHKPGGWMYEKRDERGKVMLANNPDQINLLKRRVRLVADGVLKANEAYNAHRGPKCWSSTRTCAPTPWIDPQPLPWAERHAVACGGLLLVGERIAQ